MTKQLLTVTLCALLPASAGAQPVPVRASYDGGLKLASEDGQYEVKLSFKGQVRFTATRSLDDDGQFLDAFSIPRARFAAEGHFFGEDNRFKLETSLGDNGSYAFIKDFYVERRLAASDVWFRAGQWKRPFNRAELVSDFASEFNERSIENELAGGGRSLGIAVHDDYEKSPAGIEWVVGVFNTFNGGSDRPALSTACTADPMTGAIDCTTMGPTTVPRDFGPTLVARIGFNSPGMKGYSEGDLEGGPLRYAVGASYKIDLANFAAADQDSWADNTSHGLELDTMIKVMGFSFEAGVVMMKIKDADPRFGVYAQPGMMLVPRTLQVAGRFALTTMEEAGPTGTVDGQEVEARAALSYYFHGHAWKFLSDAGFLVFTGDEPTDDEPELQFRLTLQMAI